MYINKAKFFEKDPMSRIIFKEFIGDSLVMIDGDQEWSQKRKVMSAAFYKDKLVKMTEVVREVVNQKIKEMESDYIDTGKLMNVAREMGDMQNRIFLTAVFGLKDLYKERLPYLEKGQTIYIDIGEYLRKLTVY